MIGGVANSFKFINNIDLILSIPIEMEAFINSIAPTASEAYVKVNKACSVNWAITTSQTATVNDINNAAIKGTLVLLANTLTNISITGLTANTTYYLHRYYTGTQPQNSIFLRTTTTLTQTGIAIYDPSDSSLVTKDGSNLISVLQSRVNNYRLIQYTAANKPLHSNNAVVSDIINDLLTGGPNPTVDTSFTLAFVTNLLLGNSYIGGQQTNPVFYINLSSSGTFQFFFFGKSDNWGDTERRNKLVGEHRMIVTYNGTNCYIYRDGILISTLNESVSNAFMEINRILGTSIFTCKQWRFYKIIDDFTASGGISALDAELQNYNSGNAAPYASAITLDKASVQQGTPVIIQSYTYNDAESDIEDLTRLQYAWQTSGNGGVTWVMQSNVTNTYTPSLGEVGRLIRGGAMVFAQTGNFASGEYVWSNGISITA